MTGKIFQVEIDIISKSVIIKAMIDGAFCTVFLICILVYMYMYMYTYKILAHFCIQTAASSIFAWFCGMVCLGLSVVAKYF